MSALRIKRKIRRVRPAWQQRVDEIARQIHQHEGADPVPTTLLMLLRDLEGYVHTPRGYMPEAGYHQCREKNPDVGLPRYEDIPLMTALSPGDLELWSQGLKPASGLGIFDPAKEREHDAHAIARFEGEGGAVGAHQ